MGFGGKTLFSRFGRAPWSFLVDAEQGGVSSKLTPLRR
jgi:hypothetical protein